MYLTKIELDIRSQAVHSALADCQRMHRMLCGLFSASRQDAKLLYRLREDGGNCSVYLYSAVPVLPNKLLPFMRLAGQRDLSAWTSSFQPGCRMGFDLITMPCKKVPRAEGNSRRRALDTEDARLNWLRRKAAQNGFSILFATELASSDFSGSHPQQGNHMEWKAWHYRGVLEILDADAFVNALADGIGPGKAYGLGMILLA